MAFCGFFGERRLTVVLRHAGPAVAVSVAEHASGGGDAEDCATLLSGRQVKMDFHRVRLLEREAKFDQIELRRTGRATNCRHGASDDSSVPQKDGGPFVIPSWSPGSTSHLPPFQRPATT